jgi:hypothetical protein
LDSSPDNPGANQPPAFLKEDELREVIGKSGYPLQIGVASDIRSKFSALPFKEPLSWISEEWSYVDETEGKLRSLDLCVWMHLYDRRTSNKFRTRPVLALLVECKQAELPYVFFGEMSPKLHLSFPTIAGLNHRTIVLRTGGEMSTWHESINDCLSLHSEAFSSLPLARSSTFSRVVREGKLVLSGDSSFNEIVNPLIKATRYFVRTSKPRPTFAYFEVRAVVPLCILNAPMVLAEASGKLIAVPWVRVMRQQADDGDDAYHGGSEPYAMDIVHRNYFDVYWAKYLIPFAQTFAQKVRKHGGVLVSGKGFVPDIDRQLSDLEPHLRRSRHRA